MGGCAVTTRTRGAAQDAAEQPGAVREPGVRVRARARPGERARVRGGRRAPCRGAGRGAQGQEGQEGRRGGGARGRLAGAARRARTRVRRPACAVCVAGSSAASCGGGELAGAAYQLAASLGKAPPRRPTDSPGRRLELCSTCRRAGAGQGAGQRAGRARVPAAVPLLCGAGGAARRVPRGRRRLRHRRQRHGRRALRARVRRGRHARLPRQRRAPLPRLCPRAGCPAPSRRPAPLRHMQQLCAHRRLGAFQGRTRDGGHCGAQASSRRAQRYPAQWMRTGASRRR